MPLLAGAAEAKKLQGVEQQPEAGSLLAMEVHLGHGALLQQGGGSAVDAGEMVLIPLRRGIERLAVGEVATAHQTLLLQQAQMAIHRGQAHGQLALAQQGMDLLAGQFRVRVKQLLQQPFLLVLEACCGDRRGHGLAWKTP